MNIIKRPKIKTCTNRVIEDDSLGVLKDFTSVLERDLCDLNIFYLKLPQVKFVPANKKDLL